MRIAYVTPYQGPTLPDRRPIVRNLSLANRVKIQLIAEMLHSEFHDVVVISQGEVVEHAWMLYRAFAEPQRFHAHIPVDYASALPLNRMNGAWSSISTVRLFMTHHRRKPFDVVVIYNMKWPQIATAVYAGQRLGLPIVLEYEDDAFLSIHDEAVSPISSLHRAACGHVIRSLSGCAAVSPFLLSQLPPDIPHLLLRGVIGDDLVRAERLSPAVKANRVVFAGTHTEANGVAALIEGWKEADLPGWELHITGQGELTPALRASAAAVPTIVFHGLLSRQELVGVLASASICVNPHKVSSTPGMVFAFKIIEYLAAGAHVVTTPMGQVEPELETAITYLPDNSPQAIARTLTNVIKLRLFENTAVEAVHRHYGPTAVSAALGRLLCDAVSTFRRRAQPARSIP